jgi:hydrogenase maturation factor HypF (carbamoyltransferase family)
VQHHAAHLGALAAEHQLTGPLLGAVLDGHGLGEDGQAWGGELLLLEGARCRRLGHIAPLTAPGGDRAAREPWRMGLAALAALGLLDSPVERRLAARPGGAGVMDRLRAGGMSRATSLGRLFDAAAALLGVSETQAYEGEAAMRLEALASDAAPLQRVPTLADAGRKVWIPVPALRAAGDDAAKVDVQTHAGDDSGPFSVIPGRRRAAPEGKGIQTYLAEPLDARGPLCSEAARSEVRLDAGYQLTDGVLDFAPLLGRLAAGDLDPAAGASLFHATLAAGLADWIGSAAHALGHRRVALGGGCMVNQRLAEGLARRLRAAGLTPLLASAVPPNDGGLSLGQALIARRAALRPASPEDVPCVSPFPSA